MNDQLEKVLEITEEKPQGKREDDQKFLTRILQAVHDLPDGDWKKLPRDVKNWFNEGSDAFNEDEPIPMFPGMDGAGGDDEEEEEERPRRGRGRSKKKAASSGRGRRSRNRKDEEEEEEGDEEEEEEKPRSRRGRRSSSRSSRAPKAPEPAGDEIDADVEDLEEEEEVTLLVKDGRSTKMVCGEVVDVTSRALVILDFMSEQEEKIPLNSIKGVYEHDEADLAALKDAGEEEQEEEEEKPARRGRGSRKKKGARGSSRRGRRSRSSGDEEEGEEEEEEEKPTRRGRGRSRRSTRGAGSKKKSSSRRSRSKKGDGPDVPVSRRIRQMMAEKPTITQKALETKLEKEGYEDVKPNTIRLTMSGFTEVYEALQAEERIVED